MYVFNEETSQLSSWARSEWARKFAPIPPLKGVHTTTQNAKLVLSTVADYSNPTYCGSWPSIDTIREETGLSRRAIQYALRALEAMGLIEEAPRHADACPPYLAIPADKRPVFYHVYFIWDSRFITSDYRDWADERLAQLREKYTKQHRAGCNAVPSGVQRSTERGATGDETGCNGEQSGVQPVAYKTDTKQISNSNIYSNTYTCHGDEGTVPFKDPDEALDALSTDPDRVHAQRLADLNPDVRRLRDEVNRLKNGQTPTITAPSQWTRNIG
ncbi:helix-turn-helix domain-containing protein [Corynebacterium coyleae]|uniref:helix-turn-helix domain-containing protein n=1 Tax=Corynebacterium coyleae TaxID=53374 RepID=UPI003D75CAAB|nr:helix-turn-helix domain-containing protein [Corynebacterium coyleae]